jgi:hypothetical protein
MYYFLSTTIPHDAHMPVLVLWLLFIVLYLVVGVYVLRSPIGFGQGIGILHGDGVKWMGVATVAAIVLWPAAILFMIGLLVYWNIVASLQSVVKARVEKLNAGRTSIEIDMPVRVRQQLLDLEKAAGHSTMGELFQEAMGQYEFTVSEKNAGSVFYVKRKGSDVFEQVKLGSPT